MAFAHCIQFGEGAVPEHSGVQSVLNLDIDIVGSGEFLPVIEHKLVGFRIDGIFEKVIRVIVLSGAYGNRRRIYRTAVPVRAQRTRNTDREAGCRIQRIIAGFIALLGADCDMIGELLGAFICSVHILEDLSLVRGNIPEQPKVIVPLVIVGVGKRNLDWFIRIITELRHILRHQITAETFI